MRKSDEYAAARDIRDRIASLITERDRSVSEAARRVGISHTTLHRLVLSGRARPSLETIARIALAYGVSVDWILNGGDDDASDDGERAVAMRIIDMVTRHTALGEMTVQEAVSVAYTLAAMRGVGVGGLATLDAWRDVAIRASHGELPRPSRSAPRHSRVREGKSRVEVTQRAKTEPPRT